jgi:hypothetical protein
MPEATRLSVSWKLGLGDAGAWLRPSRCASHVLPRTTVLGCVRAQGARPSPAPASCLDRLASMEERNADTQKFADSNRCWSSSRSERARALATQTSSSVISLVLLTSCRIRESTLLFCSTVRPSRMSPRIHI